jgi:(p)ppGpp synthase/HD superfamily hydrolase
LTGPDIDTLAAKIAERLTALPRWMKLKQAVLYSNIGKDRLITLAKLGHIKGGQDTDLKSKPWIFDRKSIDEYRSKQVSNSPQNDAEEFALDFITKIGL